MKFTKKQERIRNRYKKKYGKEMPLPKPIIDRWEEQPLIIKKIEKDNQSTNK